MARNAFRLNQGGGRAVLKTIAAPAVNQVVDKVAAKARGMVDEDVEVISAHYTTDRRAGAVVIADERGLALQATGGVLTRAAAACGLEVTSQ